MVTKARVSLWGRTVGAVIWIEERQRAAFQYDAAFCRSGLDVAPIMMPLAQAAEGATVFSFGDVRDEGGFFVNLPGLTVEAFEAAGARFYNDAILVTAVGSLPIRVGRQFTAARKLGRTHQNVLVFCKGDPRKATEACGAVEFGEIEAAEGDPDEDPEDDQ